MAGSGMALAVVLLVVIVWAIVSTIPGRGRRPTDDDARILKARFAGAEISQAECEQARRLLEI